MVSSIDWDLVADLYDRHVSFDRDLPFWRKAAAAADGPVLELMAGTGRVSVPLAEDGVDLTCVDRSAAMLDRLHRKLLRNEIAAELVEADICRLDYQGLFSLVLLPFHGFTELVTGENQRSALRAVHRALVPGGRFLVNIHDPATRRRSADGVVRLVDTDRSREGLLVVTAVETVPGDGRVVERLQFYEHYDPAAALVWKRCLPMRFVLHEPEAFRRMAEEAGFTVAEIFGTYAEDPYEPGTSPTMLWDLRRPR